MYLEELDRIVLKNKTTKANFATVSSVRKVTILTRVMQLVHQVLSRWIHVTKRDLFYTDVKLFKDQKDSDAVLDDISCMLGCTRNSLHVVASEKGVVVGRLQYKEDGGEIDCTKMGVGGKAIPSNIDKVSDMRSDAKFVLLVEKDAAFMRLAEDRFYNKYQMHHHHRQRSTGRRHPTVFEQGEARPEDPRPRLGGRRSVRFENHLRVHAGIEKHGVR